MALTATMRRFEIALADSDRGVYVALDLRVAQHPSETARSVVARVIARALEHADGVELGRGLCVDDEPAIVRRDLRGDLVAWIEVGAPSPERLHKAMKTSPRVAVYALRRADALAEAIRDARVHRAADLELYELPADALDAVAAGLERTHRWELAVAGGTVYLATGSAAHELPVRRVPIPPA